MKKSRFTEAQIIKALKMQEEQGKKVSEICRELGISEPTFHNWKSRYGGMSLSELTRAKELEQENARLKKIVADQQLSIDILKEINSKKW
ncbi:MAG: transposase [Bacteroidetes bacterium]|nr:transposase [Bacteroidota bacterium]